MCDNCEHDNEGGFLFGMIIGGIIGAFVAIYLYKNNKTQVFDNFQEKLQSYFKNIIPQTEKTIKKTKKIIIVKEKELIAKISPVEKIPVILPHDVVTETTIQKPIASKPKKMFKK